MPDLEATVRQQPPPTQAFEGNHAFFDVAAATSLRWAAMSVTWEGVHATVNPHDPLLFLGVGEVEL